MSQQNVETIRGIYDAFGRGDIPAIIGQLADDVEWNSPATLPWGGHAHGHDGVLAFFGRLGGAVEELRAEWAMVWELRDGKVTSFSDYVDTAAVVAAFAGVAA